MDGPAVERDSGGGYTITIEHPDGSRTVVSTNRPKTSVVLQIMAKKAGQA
jgi:murein DD-endopeptidase MepM/ murein hydrolase activator NlpD